MKKNYLLVMPRLIQNPNDGYSFPLGIAYISASLKRAGFNVFTLNLNHRQGKIAKIVKNEITKNKINVAAVGGLSFQYSLVKTVLEAVKKVDSRITLIVGGGLITSDPEPAMKALEIADIGVIGEGEETVVDLCRALENNEDLARVKGLIYRKSGSFVTTDSRPVIKNLDVLPWPDYEGFEIEKYLKMSPPGISGLNSQNTLFMLGSRSCPYNCTFCFHTTGNVYRQRSLDNFFQELDFLVRRYQLKFLCLADELFSQDAGRVKEFCQRIKPYHLGWWAQFRVDDITPEFTFSLKEGGCRVMALGLESADNRILKSMRKGITVQQIERAIGFVNQAGLTPEGSFIFGDREETWDTAQKTFAWWRAHSQFRFNLNFITVYPGTVLYRDACARGLIKDRVKFIKEGCPQINVSKLSDSKMAKLAVQVMEAPGTLAKNLDFNEAGCLNVRTGRVSLKGKCTVCGKRNKWFKVKLFTNNSVICQECGQKYNVSLPAKIKARVENNLEKLLQKNGKIAFWGINQHVFGLLKNSRLLKNKNLYPVDISQIKRAMGLHGRMVYEPEVINKEGIKVVVVAIPVYFTPIAAQIEINHQGVKKIIDICKLIK